MKFKFLKSHWQPHFDMYIKATFSDSLTPIEDDLYRKKIVTDRCIGCCHVLWWSKIKIKTVIPRYVDLSCTFQNFVYIIVVYLHFSGFWSITVYQQCLQSTWGYFLITNFWSWSFFPLSLQKYISWQRGKSFCIFSEFEAN